jgi:YD repeat-containing protein
MWSVLTHFPTSHNYVYDNPNRRTQATLEDGSLWKYTYDNRNELTGAGRFWSDWSPVTSQQYGYDFDNLGNRTSAQVGSVGNLSTVSYAVNCLNEQALGSNLNIRHLTLPEGAG